MDAGLFKVFSIYIYAEYSAAHIQWKYSGNTDYIFTLYADDMAVYYAVRRKVIHEPGSAETGSVWRLNEIIF